MVGLSEKAKGKQRAVEPQNEEEQSTPALRPVIIRFADSTPDLQLTLGAADTVRRVKQKIRESRPQMARRRLRLIYSGRIFSNDVILLECLQSAEKRQRRSGESQDAKEKGKARDDTDFCAHEPSVAQNATPTWLHCSVGAELAEGEDEDEDRLQETQIKPLRGFDRLAAAGFSAEDIANFRRTFHSRSALNYLDTEPIGDDEDYEEYARALEERWIESLANDGDSSISPASASSTLLQGLLAGFFFPLLPFFFFHEARPAVFWEHGRSQEVPSSVVFSRRMQMAVILGFVLNITFGIWRYVFGN